MIYYYSVSRRSFFSIRQNFSYHVTLIIASALYKVPIVSCPRATLFNFSSKIITPRATRKSSNQSQRSGKIWCMPRDVFPKKETVFSFPHESDFGDCDGTKPRFRRVALQRLPSRYSDCLLVFSRHSAPLIFKQCLRVLPFATRPSVESRRHQS